LPNSGGAIEIFLPQTGLLLPLQPFSERLPGFLQRCPQFISPCREFENPASNLVMAAADLEFPATNPANAGMRKKFDLPPDRPLNL
jgi:hypothetical protein